MLLQCGHCGAPLDVREDAAIVKCAYCGFKTERTRFVTLAHQTPAGFAPPKVWRPPPHVAAASDVELAYVQRSSPAAALVITLAVILAIAGAAVVPLVFVIRGAGGGGGGVLGGLKLAALADKELAGSPTALSKRLGGGRVDDKSLYVKLSDPRFDQLYFLWDAKDLTHPYYAGSIMSQGEAVPSGTCDRLAASLGEFRDKGWYLGDAHVSCDPAGGVAVYVASPGANEHEEADAWKARVALLYRLEMDAVLGREASVTSKELRAVLGSGFATADLAKLDLDADIDGAKEMLARALDGNPVTTDGARYELMLADSPLPRVSFSWNNQKAGKLGSVSFSTSGWQPLDRAQAKVAACLEKTLGAPQIDETDHVKKKVSYRFKGYAVYLNDSNLSVSEPKKPIWQALVKALAGCEA